MFPFASSSANVRLLVAAVVTVVMTAACTPQHTTDTSAELARTARLLPGVAIERESQLRLSRQAPICLVSGQSGADRGALLGHAQQGLAKHFVAVGVEPVAMSYLEMVAVRPCEASVYLVYLQPICDDAAKSECAQADRFQISVVQRADGRLVDQIGVRLKKGFWQLGRTDTAQLAGLFDELGRALTID